MGSEWVNIVQAAEILGIERSTMYGRISKRQFIGTPARLVPDNERSGPTHLIRFYFPRKEIEQAALVNWRQRHFASDGLSPSVEESVYLAGLFDGEGCVQIVRRDRGRRCYYINVTIVNTYADAMHWIHATFGGSLRSRQPAGNSKRTWTWAASTSCAYRTLQRISPFLRIKHEQARLAIGLYEHVVQFDGSRYHQLTAEELVWREEQYRLLRQLNARGKPVPSSEAGPG